MNSSTLTLLPPVSDCSGLLTALIGDTVGDEMTDCRIVMVVVVEVVEVVVTELMAGVLTAWVIT